MYYVIQNALTGGYMVGNVESKRDRFVRIVERRVNQILNNLDSLGKCANRKNYEYTDKDVSKIFAEIERKTKSIKAIYAGKSSRNSSFKLT